MIENLKKVALDLHSHGLTPIPTVNDGSKAPAFRWQDHIDHQASLEQVESWFGHWAGDGLGIICGASSRNLEMLELEGRALDLLQDIDQLMAANGATEIWQRINDGWVEMTPSGGVHLHYRISDGPARRNLKLARDEFGLVLIETRGQGGFTILAPSGGRTHPTGKSWTLITGGPGDVPNLTSDERDLIHAVCTLLDRQPTPVRQEPSKPRPIRSPLEVRPGDDFDARTSWSEILTPHGWTCHQMGSFTAWTRPGKSWGISATTGRTESDRLFVFSSSTRFETETPISKFAAFAELNHDGNYSAAASDLARQGYGAKR